MPFYMKRKTSVLLHFYKKTKYHLFTARQPPLIAICSWQMLWAWMCFKVLKYYLADL